MKSFTAHFFALAAVAHLADAHGRLVLPPHRGYIGKLPQFKGLVPINYSDHGLSAGGIGQTSGGKNGICGDPYTGVREHETGGTYGRFPQHREKVIGACYAPGSTIGVQVQLTANHKGFFEFGLCKLNSLNDKETEECFQALAEPSGLKEWQVPPGNGFFDIQYVLPSGVTCDGDSHCVLRWHYTGWNNPGVDARGQEHFWNCADVYISNTCGSAPQPSKPTQAPGTTAKPIITTGAPVSTASPVDPTGAPATTSAPVNPTQAPVTPSPPVSDCGSCTNCYYAPTNACFIGWNQGQCNSAAAFKWCGAGAQPPTPSSSALAPTYAPAMTKASTSAPIPTPSAPKPPSATQAPGTTAKPIITTGAPVSTASPVNPSGAPATTSAPVYTTKTPVITTSAPVNPTQAPVTPSPPVSDCGSCTNCYYAPTNACFVGWSQGQCNSASALKWCGAGAQPPTPSSSAPTPTYPPAPTYAPATTKASTSAPIPTPSAPKPSSATPTNAPAPGPSTGLTNILPKSLFLQIFPQALPIYKYENLVAIAAKYPEFANTGNVDVDRREVAAFLGQISLESGDLRYVEEINKSTMCQQSAEYPCAAGKQYFGRGPIQLSWNYNYKDFGKAVNLDLVASPELVATDYDLVWWSALWYWNADKWNGNIHKVVGLPGGFAKTTFIINGGLECGLNPPNRESEKSRIASFKKFCTLLGVAPGDNLSCQTADFPPKSPWTDPPAGSSVSPSSSAPTPSSSGPATSVPKTVSWNWFASSTTDCDASLSKDTLNRGFYVGGENIPADCGKTASFTYNGVTVTATYAWRTTGGQGYNELSPQAFAKILGTNVDISKLQSAQAVQAAINDPGRIYAVCTGGKC
ncbi:hypothetical protein DYB26_013603 [Aphanomyces astaci]|uniref:Glycoside hydrolase family 19 catalytic domain-containing protein n=2 Tax=Aphanomyces astaci TaxID=112090 RepID=A0A3R6YQD4_APHAT|nr:hypothetical protein DYB26_013603 [Aphanomyces astaci]